MYLINKTENKISKLTEKSFGELGFKERDHLQEWIAGNPEVLGEELLIIQKEFSGFSDTKERLDLLALDKQGDLVIIENKLDDTGRDVTWQALKYASYCSSLSKSQIKDIYQEYLDRQGNDEKAEDNLIEFFDNEDYEEIPLNRGSTQRIIFVAANFRKEVTSTVLWLLNYQLRIQCFKVAPYELENQLFLNVEQIIPMKDAEEYVISMSDKTREDITSQEELKSRHLLRLEFWKNLLKEINSKSDIYQNISPSKDSWISKGIGFSGVGLNFVISKTYARSELWILRSTAEESKFIFDELYKNREEIEKKFGDRLTWERLDNKKACRIKYELQGVNVFNKEDWPQMIDFMTDGMIRMEKAFREPLKAVKEKFKSGEV